VIVPFGGLDIVGMLHAVGRQDFIKMTIQVLEKYMQEAAERGVQKVSVIFDLEAFNLRQYAWRPGKLITKIRYKSNSLCYFVFVFLSSSVTQMVNRNNSLCKKIIPFFSPLFYIVS
jgi:hypothetical protein